MKKDAPKIEPQEEGLFFDLEEIASRSNVLLAASQLTVYIPVLGVHVHV